MLHQFQSSTDKNNLRLYTEASYPPTPFELTVTEMLECAAFDTMAQHCSRETSRVAASDIEWRSGAQTTTCGNRPVERDVLHAMSRSAFPNTA